MRPRIHFDLSKSFLAFRLMLFKDMEQPEIDPGQLGAIRIFKGSLQNLQFLALDPKLRRRIFGWIPSFGKLNVFGNEVHTHVFHSNIGIGFGKFISLRPQPWIQKDQQGNSGLSHTFKVRKLGFGISQAPESCDELDAHYLIFSEPSISLWVSSGSPRSRFFSMPSFRVFSSASLRVPTVPRRRRSMRLSLRLSSR